MLQAVRGSLVNIIMDSYSSHITLQRQSEKDSRSKLVKLLQGNRALLAASGVKITVATGKRHQRVGRAEKMVAQIKQLLLEKMKSHIFQDFFDVNHKMSLIQSFINERPVFFENGVLTPYSIESAMLKRSSGPIKIFTLSQFIIPQEKHMRNLMTELASESRSVLNLIASETCKHLLNRKVINQTLSVGQLVYCPDLLIQKNPHSMIESLAKVKRTLDGRNFELELLNKKRITRHISALVPTRANHNLTQTQNIDPFQIINCEEVIVPSQVSSKFGLNLQQFDEDGHNDDENVDHDNSEQLILPLIFQPSDPVSPAVLCEQ